MATILPFQAGLEPYSDEERAFALDCIAAGDLVAPFEMVKRLATPNGLAAIIRASLRQARFRRLARISVRTGRFVAELEFVEPVGPERQRAVVIPLPVRPEVLG